MRLPTLSLLAPAMLALAIGAGGGCIGGRYETQTAGSDLETAARGVVKAIADARAAKNLQPPTWVNELRPVAARGALGVARGDLSLKTAAHQTALQAVTELGRHVWSFVTECTDVTKFQPPALALQGRTLLLGVAVATAPGGQSVVVLTIAEPGTSALRADQMGGGGGGTNPTLEAYAHPVVASAPCGASWPVAPAARF